MSILGAARSAYSAGLSLLPVRNDGSKAPDVTSWRECQTVRPNEDQMRAFAFGQRSGMGMVSGAGSRYRECWDFDEAKTFDAFIEAATSCELQDVVQRIRAGYEDETPGGGRRWIVTYPDSVDWQDCTLARRSGQDGEPKIKTLIELPTFSIVAPSNGGTHPTGRPYVRVSGSFDTIATYTLAERTALIELARSFDQMPRRQQRVPAAPKTDAPGGDLRPGDDFNARTLWSALLEPAGWTEVFARGDVSFWRRPDKTFGISATTNFGDSDLFYPFTSSTEFSPETSYSKFGAYALLKHGGDFGKAALALSKQGYGDQDETTAKDSVPTEPSTPRTLSETETTFARWIRDDDLIPTRAVLAAYVANRQLEGDPVWLMLVGGSGVGKTERLIPLAIMPDVVLESSITGPAALLSGTARKERTKDATGGLLRKVPEGGGVLVLKDFTSIIDMHRESRAEVLAALREVFDGRWDRSIGSDGGRTLTWEGRLGLLAGCTTAIDSAHSVMSVMGTRFLLVRLTGDPDIAGSAFDHVGEETSMREALRDSVRGLLEHLPGQPFDKANIRTPIIALASYVARARSPVDRDQRGDIRLVLDPEAPTRITKMLVQLWQASGLLGLDQASAWEMVCRVGMDSIPKLRRAALDYLATCPAPATTTDVAEAVEHPRQTTRRSLEDLTAHQVIVRTPGGQGRADCWALAAQTRRWLDETVPVLSEQEESDAATVPVSSEEGLPGVATVPGSSEETYTSTASGSISKDTEHVLDDKAGKVARPVLTSDGKPFVFDPTTAFGDPKERK